MENEKTKGNKNVIKNKEINTKKIDIKIRQWEGNKKQNKVYNKLKLSSRWIMWKGYHWLKKTLSVHGRQWVTKHHNCNIYSKMNIPFVSLVTGLGTEVFGTSDKFSAYENWFKSECLYIDHYLFHCIFSYLMSQYFVLKYGKN